MNEKDATGATHLPTGLFEAADSADPCVTGFFSERLGAQEASDAGDLETLR